MNSDSIRILYAEDDFANRKLLEVQMRKEGWDCLCVENGLEALETLTKQPGEFDLLVMDKDMPKMGGLEAIRQIRKKEIEIPAVALTSDDSFPQELLEAGFDRVLTKPLLDKSYLETFRELIGIH